MLAPELLDRAVLLGGSGGECTLALGGGAGGSLGRRGEQRLVRAILGGERGAVRAVARLDRDAVLGRLLGERGRVAVGLLLERARVRAPRGGARVLVRRLRLGERGLERAELAAERVLEAAVLASVLGLERDGGAGVLLLERGERGLVLLRGRAAQGLDLLLALARESLLERRARCLGRGGRLLGALERLLELARLGLRRLVRGRERLRLRSLVRSLLLEVAMLCVEGRPGGLRLLQELGRLGERALAVREVGLDLLELLVLREHRLAEVEELRLAPALRGGVAGGARAFEIGLALRDLALELADLAQRAAVVHAGMLAARVLGDDIEAEVDRGVRAAAAACVRVDRAGRARAGPPARCRIRVDRCVW